MRRLLWLDPARAFVATKIALVDTLYPRRCAGCGRRGRWVCVACAMALPLAAPPWCRRCGEPEATGLCRCDDLPPALSALRAGGPFDGWLRSAILNFKYHDEWGRAEHLGDLVAAALVDLGPVDALVPVPLHPSRQRMSTQ